MDPVSHTVINLIIFVLAIYVGYHVVWTVTPALHTPLMAVTNAISAIVIVGAMLAAALTETPLGKTMGVLAVALAAVNVFGGFLVTRRMLEMFKKKDKKAPAAKEEAALSHEPEPRHAAVPDRLRLLHPGAEGPVPPDHLDPRQRLRHGRHGDRRADHRRADRQARRGGNGARPGLGAARPGGRRRLRRLPRQDGRDDQDARAGGLLPQHDRPGGGLHRGGRRGRAAGPSASPRQCGEAHMPDAATALELFLGAAIGAITFSGSVIAFGKLSGKYKFRLFQGAPVQFAGQHMLNLVLGLLTIALGLLLHRHREPGAPSSRWLALAFVLGVLIIIPIGGADMPVVVSMLNSYSGWAAAGIGFSLNNAMLIIAGSLVGLARARS